MQRKKLNWRNGWQKVMKMRKREACRGKSSLLSNIAKHYIGTLEHYFLTWLGRKWDWSKRLKSLIIRKDSEFSTYATWWIRRAVRNELQESAEPFVFQFIWWEQLTSDSYQDNYYLGIRGMETVTGRKNCRKTEHTGGKVREFWRFLQEPVSLKHRSVKKRTVIWREFCQDWQCSGASWGSSNNIAERAIGRSVGYVDWQRTEMCVVRFGMNDGRCVLEEVGRIWPSPVKDPSDWGRKRFENSVIQATVNRDYLD